MSFRKNEGEINIFTDKQILRDFISSKLTLQEMVKELFKQKKSITE